MKYRRRSAQIPWLLFYIKKEKSLAIKWAIHIKYVFLNYTQDRLTAVESILAAQNSSDPCAQRPSDLCYPTTTTTKAYVFSTVLHQNHFRCASVSSAITCPKTASNSSQTKVCHSEIWKCCLLDVACSAIFPYGGWGGHGSPFRANSPPLNISVLPDFKMCSRCIAMAHHVLVYLSQMVQK